MSQDTVKQIKELIVESKKILITAPPDSGEGLSLALALKMLFTAISKPADVVIAPHDQQKKFDFLANFSELLPEIKKIKKCVVEVDVSQTGLQELSYDVNQGKLKIFLTPRQGFLATKDVTVKDSEFAYSLIIAVTTEALDTLGLMFQNHREVFQKIPVINLDHRASNDRFGHLNWVDITLPSSAAQILDLIKLWPEVQLTKDLATALLAALISGTKNFQNNGNQTLAFDLASQLMKQGADRELIIKKLYQTKTLQPQTLGPGTFPPEEKGNGKIIWSYLTRQDFLETQAEYANILELMEELFLANPRAELLTLFIEKDLKETLVFCQTKNHYPLNSLARSYNPSGGKYTITLTLNKPLVEAQTEILTWLENQVIAS